MLFFLFAAKPLLASVEPNVASTGALATRVFLGLLLVLLLMFTLAWLAKRMRLAPGVIGSSSAIQTLAVSSLGSREKLLLVQVGEEQLLLGVTSQQITCLHELKTPIDLAKKDTKPAFKQFMQDWLVKNKATTTDSKEKGSK
ncbi:flagellar biosynthetic protein FliO [Marinospirillum insulare]|uniref:flagellar biosynthetic protein FliO n=1 Tax=Marinospirillum insulare TaxID=217169 RepID=UPI0013643EEC|nr:flagellar biosynthetic protein FliO [Marinospirillum insulare]